MKVLCICAKQISIIKFNVRYNYNSNVTVQSIQSSADTEFLPIIHFKFRIGCFYDNFRGESNVCRASNRSISLYSTISEYFQTQQETLQ